MGKRISIDQLRPGMRIEKLDRSWLATPFLRHRMAITSIEQIERLRASGVQTVEMAADELDVVPSDTSYHMDGLDKPVDVLTVEKLLAPAPASPSVPFEEELPTAKEIYRSAKHIVGQAMRDVRMGRALEMEAVHQVVSEMAESMFRNADALTSLSRLKRFDEYTFYHSVNTALLALSLGRSLGYDRPAVHQLGIGCLLHDIGKTKVPLDILNKPGRFATNEFEIMKQHVLRGVEILAATAGLDDVHTKPALEHHERVDGTGYPHRRRRAEISEFGLIATIVDIYDAITSDRCYHKAKSAHEALQFLFLISHKGHLDHTLVQRFIQVVGVYPVGSVVELNTGEIAIVQRLHHDAPLEPVVLVVKGPGNVLLPHPEEHDLMHQRRTPRRTITAAKDAMSTGLNPNLYLDKESL